MEEKSQSKYIHCPKEKYNIQKKKMITNSIHLDKACQICGNTNYNEDISLDQNILKRDRAKIRKCRFENRDNIRKKIKRGFLNNSLIQKIFAIIDDLIVGKMVCGAGGGGFLQVILKENVTKEMVHNRLRGVFPDSEIDIWECSIHF